MEAIVDRIIPPDPETPGGKDAGCAVFIDRQLKGPYGSGVGLYRKGPFLKGTREQGPQSELTHVHISCKGRGTAAPATLQKPFSAATKIPKRCEGTRSRDGSRLISRVGRGP